MLGLPRSAWEAIGKATTAGSQLALFPTGRLVRETDRNVRLVSAPWDLLLMTRRVARTTCRAVRRGHVHGGAERGLPWRDRQRALVQRHVADASISGQRSVIRRIAPRKASASGTTMLAWWSCPRRLWPTRSWAARPSLSRSTSQASFSSCMRDCASADLLLSGRHLRARRRKAVLIASSLAVRSTPGDWW